MKRTLMPCGCLLPGAMNDVRMSCVVDMIMHEAIHVPNKNEIIAHPKVSSTTTVGMNISMKQTCREHLYHAVKNVQSSII